MWPNQQIPADLVIFSEETFNGKLHFFVQRSKHIHHHIFCLNGAQVTIKVKTYLWVAIITLSTRMRIRGLGMLVFRKKARNFIKKEALAQVFSGEFCEISKNTFLTEYL